MGVRFRREATHTVRFIEVTVLLLLELTSPMQTQDSNYVLYLQSYFPLSTDMF